MTAATIDGGRRLVEVPLSPPTSEAVKERKHLAVVAERPAALRGLWDLEQVEYMIRNEGHRLERRSARPWRPYGETVSLPELYERAH